MKYLIHVFKLCLYSCIFFMFGLFGNLFYYIGEKMIKISDYSLHQFELTEDEF